jgi:hypothetical protein
MPEGAGGQALPYAGTPEMDALLQQVNQNPAIMQQIAQEPALLAELLKHMGVDRSDIDEVGEWMDKSADDVSGSAESEPQPTAAGDESDAEAPPVDASASPAPIGEDESDDEAVSSDQMDDTAYNAAPTDGDAMAKMNPSGGTMDDLISAQMMQRAAGNPNAAVPRVGGKGKNPRMPLPAGGGGNQQQMIADLYRQMAARQQQPRR